MERLDDILVFASVVAKGSFTAAAKELNKSTSTVSKHISRLEGALALKLLHRSTHNLTLTGPGVIYYQHCSRIIGELEEARANVAGLSQDVTGILRVYSCPGLGQSLVSRAVVDFAAIHGTASIELSIGETITTVIKHGVDVMVSSRDLITESHVNLLWKDIGPVPYAICAAPRYFEQNGVPHAPQDLQKHNCLIHVAQKPVADEWQFSESGKIQAIRVGGSIRSNLESAIVQGAIEGLGIARLPLYSVGGKLASGALKTIFESEIYCDRRLKAYYPRSSYEPRKTHAFIECIERRYKQKILE
jgi:DNA-binding transcriptional LysR family regulator